MSMETHFDELKAIYSEIEAAFRTKDLDGIAKYIASDWTGSHGENTVTQAQLLENVRSQFNDFDEISWPRTLSNPRTDGATITVRAAGLYRAIRANTGEPFQIDLANDDSWRHGPDGWQNFHSTGIEI